MTNENNNKDMKNGLPDGLLDALPEGFKIHIENPGIYKRTKNLKFFKNMSDEDFYDTSYLDINCDAETLRRTSKLRKYWETHRKKARIAIGYRRFLTKVEKGISPKEALERDFDPKAFGPLKKIYLKICPDMSWKTFLYKVRLYQGDFYRVFDVEPPKIRKKREAKKKTYTLSKSKIQKRFGGIDKNRRLFVHKKRKKYERKKPIENTTE